MHSRHLTKPALRFVAALALATVLLAGNAQASAAPRSVGGSSAVSAASGDFDAAVDFGSLELHPRPGGTCELRVKGTLIFTGTLEGNAEGRTTALVFATCDEVAANPPGTFPDVFRFSGTFTGTVAGAETTGTLTYSGVARPGGAITAVITLRGVPGALLGAEAVVAQGGTYEGVALRR